MSDDTRSILPLNRKLRPRILVVNNPSPEGSSSDDERAQASSSQPAPNNYHFRPLPSPSHAIIGDRSQSSSTAHIPPPLTTIIPEQRHCYPSSRSNPSNPALSSPSSTSSPAFESTPPPSTPGQSLPPVDLSGEGTVRQDTTVLQTQDRSDGTPPSTSRHIKFPNLKSHLQRSGHGRRSSNNSRPSSSPTTSTPDSYAPHSNLVYSTNPNESIILFVTKDSENFSKVDVSGAMTPAFIRECIFSKLQIPDEEQLRHSIYRTEIEGYAISEALTDEQLFDLYRAQGDDKGSLKLLVAHSAAPVHEPSHDPVLVSPTVFTVPPPVLPPHGLYPLHPVRKRSRSRHGSQSSTSEQLFQEAATGYEASGSDDLDHGDWEARRRLPQSRLTHAVPHRPQSPNGMHSPDLTFPYVTAESPQMGADTPRGLVPTAPLVLPPEKTQYPERGLRRNVPSVLSPDSATSDTITSPSDRPRRAQQDKEEGDKQDRDRSKRRDGQSRKEGGIRRGKNYFEVSVDGWTMVPGDLPVSGYTGDRPTTPQERSPRYGASSRFNPILRSTAASGGSGESHSQNKKRQGRQVPPTWAVTWKEPAGPGKLEPKPQSPSMLRSLRSMNDLRSASKQQQQSSQHPPSLVPGRTRPSQPAPPLVTRPSTGSGNGMSGATAQATPSTSTIEIAPTVYMDSGREPSVARSYGTRGVTSPLYSASRGLVSPSYSPSQPFGGGILDASSLPDQEPIPRPHSALDDRGSALPRQQRIHPNSKVSDSTPDIAAVMPSHAPSYSYSSTSISARNGLYHDEGVPILSRPIPVPRTEQRIEFSNGSSSPSKHLRRGPRTPPRSPAVSSTLYDGRDNEMRMVGSPPVKQESSLVGPGRGIIEEDGASEAIATIRRDEFSHWAGLIDENAMEGTLKPWPASAKSPQPSSSHQPLSSDYMTSLALVNSTNLHDDDDSDCDDDLWAKKPDRAGENHQNSRQQTPADILKNTTRPSIPQLSTENLSPRLQGKYDTSRTPPSNFPAPPDYIPQPLPLPRATKRPYASSGTSLKHQGARTSRFENEYDYTWAPRPPPEDVLERLEEYFPEHDLDRPVIEMSSGGSSPISAENPIPTPHRFKHKKSIRVVAEEHKNRTSRLESSSVTAALRKRNTKLWGSRLEEVTSEQARSDLSSIPSDSSPASSATPIFRWVRGELIGKGTYGKVYLALNATTGEMIAVKQVELPRTASDKSDSRQVTVVEALKLESETLKDLDHSNIVQYLGFEETPTFLSIFLEYVPGGSIASCLRKHGKFDEQVTKSFTGQILAGLEYLHAQGILHRDLKADNILVEKSGVCKISDFGISKRTDDINNAGAYTSMQGTVFWMAPEVINSQQGGYNSKIDIWSVGCVVYEMWTGQRPWNGQEAMAVLLRLYQKKEGPPVPSDIHLSPLADDFRQKCFATDPDQRPPAAELRKHPYLELQPGWVFNGFK